MRAALARLNSGRWRTGWRLLSAVAIVAIGLTQIDLAEVGDALAGLFLPLAALSWAILLMGQAISGVRWGVICERLGARATTSWYVRAYLRGTFYNAFLPTGIGGDALRIVALRHDIGLKESTRSVVYDRVSGLAATVLAAGVCLPFTDYLEDVPTLRDVIAALSLLAAVVAAVVLARRDLANFAALTLLFMTVWFTGIWVLARALDIHLSAAEMPIIAVIVGVAIALPISIGGTGTREAGFVVALAPLGIGTEAAVALGISFGVVLALVGLVGAPLSVAPEHAEASG